MKRTARSLPDTNTIIRYLVSDDPGRYRKAKEFFDRVRDGGERAIILESVVAECIYVLMKMYKVPRDRAARSLIDILRYKGIANDDRQELIGALTLFSEQGLDIVDCILCAKASARGNHLFTFDSDLNRMNEKSKEHMNKETEAVLRANRVREASKKVCEESMRVNADFAAIEEEPDA